MQAMACCWALPRHGVKVNAEVAAPMAEDHSCCPGGEVHGASEAPSVPDQASHGECGAKQQGSAALCCVHTEPVEVTAFSAAFFFVQSAFVTHLLPALPEKPSGATPSPTVLASSGPPRYLALERILI
jgi:hypothetical protein